MQLKYKGKTTFLRLYNDQNHFPSEQETDAALKRLLAKKLPKVVFLQGEAERSIDRMSSKDYSALANLKSFRYSLINQGFDVDNVSLATQDIPDDITALVIADPRIDFTPAVLAKLQAYINKGGNLMIAGDAGKQAILNPLLAPMGVTMLNGILIQKDKKNLPSYVGALLSKEAASIESRLHIPFLDSARVSMPEAVGLSYAKTGPYTITPLLMTDARSTWNKKGVFSEDSIEVNYSGKDGDQIGSFPTALALTRQINGRQQRIIVTGDADFASNGEVGKRGPINFPFVMTLLSWFDNDQFPPDTSRPKSKDLRVNLTLAGLKIEKMVYFWVVPGLFIIFAGIFLIRRKRK
jgi:ABC-2 type transport system permease protein